MYKIYFKQSLRMLRQNPFMSLITIIGTALAIMMIMTMIVSEEAKSISLAPEINRDRTYYIHYQIEKDTTGRSSRYGSFTEDTYRDYFSEMTTPEAITIVNSFRFHWQNYQLVNTVGSKEYIPATIRTTDANFWHIFSFEFLKGSPFTKEIAKSGLKEAVITESMAKKLFKGEQALGQTFEIYDLPYRVIGIVKDVSGLFSMAYGDIWVPYTSDPIWGGGYTMIILLKDKNDYPAMVQEISKVERMYTSIKPDWNISFNIPESHREFMKETKGNSAEDFRNYLRTENRKRIFILMLLLLVPAINLSGLSLSRIKKRMEEIGVRKAFGAKRHVILIQVLFENLLTSVIGGIIGLLLSYLIIFQMRFWLLGIPSNQPIPINSLISLPIILAVCLVCIILNLLSAGIPAWRAANFTIIQSITQNDKNR